MDPQSHFPSPPPGQADRYKDTGDPVGPFQASEGNLHISVVWDMTEAVCVRTKGC